MKSLTLISRMQIVLFQWPSFHNCLITLSKKKCVLCQVPFFTDWRLNSWFDRPACTAVPPLDGATVARLAVRRLLRAKCQNSEYRSCFGELALLRRAKCWERNVQSARQHTGRKVIEASLPIVVYGFGLMYVLICTAFSFASVLILHCFIKKIWVRVKYQKVYFSA